MEKAQVASGRDRPMVSITGRVSTLHAYTLPMEIWSPTAERAIIQRFLFIKKSPFA